MIFDSHLHTEFSADSDMKISDALAKAERLGIGLVTTEHLDLDFPGELDFTFSAENYWEAYAPYRKKNLRLGIEIGMQHGLAERNAAFIARVPFDEVIGSIHLVDGQDIYEPLAYDGKEQDEIYRDYFASMASCIREHPYIDVLGHIDYIARYAPYENPDVQYVRYREEIDEVLRAVVETDTVMELNTRRLSGRLARKELAPVYARYRELGGKCVTLGSDAHSAEGIGANFAVARDFAEAKNLRIVTFCERKMI